MLEAYGLDPKLLMAGFAGGVVHAFAFKQADAYTIIGSIVAGLFTSNYLGAVASKYTGIPEVPTGFIIGLSAMAIVQGIVAAVKAWHPPVAGKGDTK